MPRRWLAGLALLAALAGCTSPTGDTPADDPASPADTSTAAESGVHRAPPPVAGECHRMSHRQALEPVASARTVPCRTPHTSQTFFVGRLDLDEGEQVDSRRVQARVADACTRRLPHHAGATARDLRLTMVQAVWFTPALEQVDLGADWFRCDVVVVAGEGRLWPLPRRTAGLADAAAVRMCATAEPGTRGFRRVGCGTRRPWRAVATVDLPGKSYPSAAAMSERMEPACRAAARELSDTPLDFRWSEERPSREQWRAGRRYGICWVPTAS